jgi:hypothetical protein
MIIAKLEQTNRIALRFMIDAPRNPMSGVVTSGDHVRRARNTRGHQR